jgi:hypothetical protein
VATERVTLDRRLAILKRIGATYVECSVRLRTDEARRLYVRYFDATQLALYSIQSARGWAEQQASLGAIEAEVRGLLEALRGEVSSLAGAPPQVASSVPAAVPVRVISPLARLYLRCIELFDILVFGLEWCEPNAGARRAAIGHARRRVRAFARHCAAVGEAARRARAASGTSESVESAVTARPVGELAVASLPE